MLLMGIQRSLCPPPAEQGGLRRAHRNWVRGSPCYELMGCADFGEEVLLPQPCFTSLALGNDKLHVPLCVEGNLSGYVLWQMKHKDVLLCRVILRGLAWLIICPLLFHSVCVCVFSLPLSQSRGAVLMDCPQLQLKVQPAGF